MIWFTSDLHLNHQNILNYTQRHNYFSSIEEMNDILIENINSMVHRRKDELYILGDLALTDKQKTIELLNRIKIKKKFLIMGNHDRPSLYRNEEIKKQFREICDYKEIKYRGNMIVMCHYPLESWRAKEKGSIHIYGHVHDNNYKLNKIDNRFHVGVDTNNFKPICIDDIIKMKIPK